MANDKRKKHIKITLFAVLAVILIAAVAVTTAFVLLDVRTNRLHDDVLSALQKEKYRTKVSVDSVDVITQQISCGYAVIEMFSAWNGGDVTEKAMYDEYGKVVTSTGNSFCAEFNKQNSDFKTGMYKYCTDSELLEKIYDSLSDKVPVPIEWAAAYQGEWTLHYSLVTGMDIDNYVITVANPYGYTENISVDEFLNRTSFNSFDNMPLLYRFAFAFGIFEKNTVFIPVRKSTDS